MKLQYGVTVLSLQQLNELPSLKWADFLECPSLLAAQADFAVPVAWKKRFYRISGRNESRTLASLVDSTIPMQLEFYRFFSRNCAVFRQSGIREFSLNLDWEMIFSIPGYQEKLREILSSCFGIFHRYMLIPVIELRIPGIISLHPEEFMAFRRSLLYPVRTLIDLHPHEPGALDSIQDFARILPFECSNFRISYDAAGGNYFTAGLLECIKNVIHPVGVEAAKVCFNPGRNAEKDVFSALEAILQ